MGRKVNNAEKGKTFTVTEQNKAGDRNVNKHTNQ